MDVLLLGKHIVIYHVIEIAIISFNDVFSNLQCNAAAVQW